MPDTEPAKTICLSTTEIARLIERSEPPVSDDGLCRQIKKAIADKSNVLDDSSGIWPWTYYLSLGDYDRVFSSCQTILCRIKALSEDNYAEINKATPYYWMGCASFILRDYETAVFYFDAAASEDIRNKDEQAGPLQPPAIKFMGLDPSSHAAGELTTRLHGCLRTCIDDYQKRAGHVPALTFEVVRDQFIIPLANECENLARRALPTALMSYLLELNHRIDMLRLRPFSGTMEPFILYLLKGGQLFESILKCGGANGRDLNGKLSNVSPKLGICALKNSNGAFDISAETFDDVIQSNKMTVGHAIIRTGKARNACAHNLDLDTAGLTPESYEALAMDIAVSCLHAIATLHAKLPLPERQP